MAALVGLPRARFFIVGFIVGVLVCVAGGIAVFLPTAFGRPGDSEYAVAIVETWSVPGQEYEGYICGGVVVAEGVVATAAHCVEGRDHVSIVSGGMGTCSATAQGDRVETNQIVVHPEFGGVSLEHDIALLGFPGHLTERLGPPVKVAEAALGRLGRLVSFGRGAWEKGRPCDAWIAEVQVEALEGCESLETVQGRKLGFHSTGMLCARTDPNGDLDACAGTSGSPLLQDASDATTGVIGIVSWGIGCGSGKHPGAYVDLHAHKEWITRFAGSL